jgi:tRNA pseudouridine32 synthase/23S rRNA pseudouridine746 synthase
MKKVYELIDSNDQFLVIYKKPDVSFHSENGQLGLFETIKQHQGLSELYPVHRLDKITSGVMVMAKTAKANRQLVDQFKHRQIEKYYLAIGEKKPKKKQGLIRGDMTSARRGALKLMPTQTNPAITQFFSKSMGTGNRLFIVKPYTGKTHQIRVALKSIGCPIMGDHLYADAASCMAQDRAYLHAYSLAFCIDGKYYRFTELPREGASFLSSAFNSASIEFSTPWDLQWPAINRCELLKNDPLDDPQSNLAGMELDG